MESELVVGFQFAEDLLEGEPLVLEHGLSIVYGLNGAGKSRLLRGIRDAIGGVASPVGVRLIVRLPDAVTSSDSMPTTAGQPKSVLQAVADSLATPAEMDSWSDDRWGAPVQLQTSPANALRIVNRYLSDNSRSVGFEDVVSEIARDRLFALNPVGSKEAPAWDAWLVADPNSESISRLLTRLNDPSEDSMELFEESPVRLGGDGDAVSTNPTFGSIDLTPYGFVVGVGPRDSWVPTLRLVGPIDLGLDLIDFSADINIATRVLLNEQSHALREIEGVSFDQKALDVWIDAKSNDLRDAVNACLRQVLLDPPEASLVVANASSRFARPSAEWRFARLGGGPRHVDIELSQLSRSEQAWAEIAISDALYWDSREFFEAHRDLAPWARVVDPRRPALSIYDEPEAALHRSGEELIARYLKNQASDPRRVSVAATHSPELLDSDPTSIYEVARGAGVRGRSVVRPLDLGAIASLENLGLNPSDLLRLSRVILLVEGRHDEVVLDAFVGSRLRAARVKVLPLRGISNQKLRSTVESRVLFDHTSAQLVTVVDNLDPDYVDDIWQRALKARETSVEDAIGVVLEVSRVREESNSPRNRGGKQSTEGLAISEWLSAAIAKGLESRVTATGLSRRDVIEYLPVEHFVSGASSWSELRESHERAKAAKGSANSDFKQWLIEKFRAEFSDDRLRSAVEATDQVPLDILRLAKLLEAIASR